MSVCAADPSGESPDRLVSLSVKTDQELFVKSEGKGAYNAVVVRDSVRDLSLIWAEFSTLGRSFRPFQVPIGQEKDLTWGNVVYVLGYPLGNRRLTMGVVGLETDTGRFNVNLRFGEATAAGPSSP